VRDGWSGSPELGALTLAAADRLAVAPGRPAAFLDRDGTLNETVPDPDSGMPESPLTVAEVRLIPGAVAAARDLAEAGYVLVCVTNQPAAAKGKATLAELLEIHERVIELLGQEGVHVELSLLCPHHPDGLSEGVGHALSGACDCRKPAPGMLLAAGAELRLDLARSWMLGDTDTDVAAGRAAGCRTVLIDYRPSAHKRLGGETPDIFTPNLAEAVAQLLDHRWR
jgi:D-glycero-D-manno-heptose 1,7-bisphosphate phosphatase